MTSTIIQSKHLESCKKGYRLFFNLGVEEHIIIDSISYSIDEGKKVLSASLKIGDKLVIKVKNPPPGKIEFVKSGKFLAGVSPHNPDLKLVLKVESGTNYFPIVTLEKKSNFNLTDYVESDLVRFDGKVNTIFYDRNFIGILWAEWVDPETLDDFEKEILKKDILEKSINDGICIIHNQPE